jgi:hypothetical protein
MRASTRGIVYRAAVLASALGICCAVPASADPQTITGSYVGHGCVEVLVIVPLPVDRAAAILPAGYRPESLDGLLAGMPGLPGPTAVTDEVTTCQRGSADGIPADGPFSTSDLGLLVQPHDSTPGLHVYSLRYLLSEQRATDMLRAAEFSAYRNADIVARADGTADGSDIHLRVIAPVPYSPVFAVSIWHQHGRTTGLLRAPLIDVQTANGIGCVTADPGSPMVALTGTIEACGIGIVLHYDTVATISRA